MAEDGIVDEDEGRPRRRRWGWKGWLFGGVAGIVLLIVLALAALDTPPGRRFIVNQIQGLRPANGLRIHIGRIDGSIYGEMTIRDLRLYDPEGLFFEAPRLEVDWRPFAYLFSNRLQVESAESEFVILHKLPELIPSEQEDQPILPGFDIHVGALDIDRFRVAEQITGERRDLSIEGEADVRGGRAVVDLAARALDGGDRLVLALDAEPDGNDFDLDLELYAPEDGVIASLTGLRRALIADVSGEGTWQDWDGRALVTSGDTQVARLDLDARAGTYALGGVVSTEGLFDPGLVRRLTAPEVTVAARATLEESVLDGSFELRSQAAAITGGGAVDLAESEFEGFAAEIRMLEPSALADDMSGRDVVLDLRLDGPFATAGFAYELTAARAAFGATGFENLRVAGEGQISDLPFALPLTATASRVTGVGEAAGGILRNVSVDGTLLVSSEELVADDLVIRSDRLRGEAAVLYDFDTGNYVVGFDGDIDRYRIPGIGVVDLSARLDVTPGAGGRFAIAGRAQARFRTLENETIRSIAGGLPTIEGAIAYGADGRFSFTNATIRAPSLRFSGSGRLDSDGTIFVTGLGSHDDYGPIRLTARGQPSRPHVELALASPLPGAGITDVEAELDPTDQGFAYAVTGQSMAGPFAAEGAILLEQDPITVTVEPLRVADTTTVGRVALAEEGLVGQLALTGDGLAGEITLEPVDGVQAVSVDLAADEARIGGAVATTIRQGTLEARALLYEDAPLIEGNLNAVGVSREGLYLARVAASAEMRGGTGTVTASVAGSRGREFDFAATADIDPDSITVEGAGEFEGEPIVLTPLRLVETEEGWLIEESTLRYAGGGATISGRFGGPTTAFDATLDSVPLSVVDIFYPDMGLGGNISGSIEYRQQGDAMPNADVAVRVRSLTREGFALQPRPVNLGLNARLADQRLAARAIMESEGEQIMRAQMRLAPIPSEGGGLMERIRSAPLFAEVRYSGPGETIWQLAGVEALSLSGPVVGRADAAGTLNRPEITGVVRTENGRIESALTGTVVEGITTTGTFDGSTFVMPSFTGTTPGGGTVSGSARFDLALATGLGMDVQLQTDRAWLLRRDDIEARVSGPLSIVLSAPPAGAGEDAQAVGRIEGDLELIQGEFELGQAAPAAAIPQLNVVEINRRLDEPVEPPPPTPWQLAIDVSADNRFLVRGLGLDSEWSADLEVAGTLSTMRILGDMSLVRGSFEFAGRRFELSRGDIDFYGNTPINPSLDIVAEASVEGLDATINIGGTGSEPDIRFTSNPALPESELLSRLLFGTSITNLSAPEALQLGAAVASLQGGGGGGLNPINAVRDAIGLDRLRVVPADPAEDRGTAVAAGVYVTRNLYVEVISDGQGYSATQAEFQVTRWLSLLATISTIGRASASVEISRDY